MGVVILQTSPSQGVIKPLLCLGSADESGDFPRRLAEWLSADVIVWGY